MDKNSLYFIASIALGFLTSTIFFILGLNVNLFYTQLICVFTFVLTIILLTIFLKKKNLTLSKLLLIFFISITAILSSYIIEQKSISYNTISISREYVHLGDKKIDWFYPQQNLDELFYQSEFTIPSNPLYALIRIYIKDVDPDFRSGPALILINNKFLTFINDLAPFKDIQPSEEHKIGFVWTECEIPVGFLNEGKNTISIYVLPTVYGLDDINFKDIELVYK